MKQKMAPDKLRASDEPGTDESNEVEAAAKAFEAACMKHGTPFVALVAMGNYVGALWQVPAGNGGGRELLHIAVESIQDYVPSDPPVSTDAPAGRRDVY